MFEELYGAFWGKIWSTLFNLIGLVGVTAFSGWLGWVLLFDAQRLHSISASTYIAMSSADRRAVQDNFRHLLFAVEKPCAKKGKIVSDVSACSIFGLKIGMDVEDAIKTINGSGFSRNHVDIQTRCEKEKQDCVDYLYLKTDTFYLNAEFEISQTMSAKSISKIVTSYEPSDNPYYDPNILRPLFVKLFGAPDKSTPTDDQWGDIEVTGSAVRAYIYGERFWVTFTKRTVPNPTEAKSGVPA